jgi:hypothetical protein
MLDTLWAVARNDKIELLEKIKIPDSTKILITLLSDTDESSFWTNISQVALDKIWGNKEDGVYEQLL